MKKALLTLTVLCLVSAASADVVALRDLTDMVHVMPRDGVSVVGQDATGTILEATLHGYNVVDANIYASGGPTAGGNYLDITDATIEIALMYDDPDVNAPEELGFWLRIYAGEWDPDTESYTFSGWANAAFPVPNDGQWHVLQKATADFEEPFADAEDWTKIYKYRIDAVKWNDPPTPFNFGIGSIPEPASLLLLALGALLRRR